MTKEIEIGKIVHYYNKIQVAVIALKKDLKIGEIVHIVGHDVDFTQEVTSMQIEHEKVNKAKKGMEVAIKVDQPVRKNWRVYKSD